MRATGEDYPAINVLLVEDNPIDARLLIEALREAEGVTFNTRVADSLALGLEQAGASDVDVIVLDLSLPDSRGLATFEAMDSHYPRTPIVILTGLDDEEFAAELMQKRAQDYLVKGEASPRQLVRSLQYAIQRKRAEEVEARLAAIVRTSNEAIIGTDARGRIVSWNAGAADLLKYSEGEALGKYIDLIDAPVCKEKLNTAVERISQLQIKEHFETKCLDKEGEAIEVSLSLSPIKDTAGVFLGASIILHDITERVIEENKVRLVADTLQSALLPQTPRREDIDFGVVYHASDPTGARVGGDFYDFIEQENSVIVAVVGDVSGKGLETATTMAMVKYMLRAHMEEGMTPGECLTRLNRSLYREMPIESFITICLVALNQQQAAVAYAAAGHPRPIVCRPGRPPLPLEAQAFPPLGVSPDTRYRSSAFNFTEFRCLVMYTDGLSELRNQHNRLFGERGIIEAVAAAAGKPAQTMAERILKQAKSYSGGNVHDDIALMVIKPASDGPQQLQPVAQNP